MHLHSFPLCHSLTLHSPFSVTHLPCHSLPLFFSISVSCYFSKYISVYSPFIVLLPLLYCTLSQIGEFISPSYSYMLVFLYFFHAYYYILHLFSPLSGINALRGTEKEGEREKVGEQIFSRKYRKGPAIEDCIYHCAPATSRAIQKPDG